MHQIPGQLVGACYLVQKALIKDTLVGTQSQEAPYGEGDNLLEGLSNSLMRKA